MFRSLNKVLAGVGVLAALALGASAIAGAATSSPAAGGPSGTRPPASFPAPGTAAHEDAEKAVTGDAAAKAQDAAVKSLGGGTAGAVTTDFTGHGYEVTVTKADGTKAEVHLDSSFNVMEHPGCPGAGPARHGAMPPGGPGAPPPGSPGAPPGA